MNSRAAMNAIRTYLEVELCPLLGKGRNVTYGAEGKETNFHFKVGKCLIRSLAESTETERSINTCEGTFLKAMPANMK